RSGRCPTRPGRSGTVVIRLVAIWAGATAVAAAAVMALTLIVGGGAPVAPPPGVSDDPRLAAWLGDVVGLVTSSAGVVAAGLGVIGLPHKAGQAAAAWCAASILQLGLWAWETSG